MQGFSIIFKIKIAISQVELLNSFFELKNMLVEFCMLKNYISVIILVSVINSKK